MKEEMLKLIKTYTNYFFITPTKQNKSILMLIFPYTPFELLNKKEYAQIDAYYFISNESYHKTKELCEKLSLLGISATYRFDLNYKKTAVEINAVGMGKNTLCYTTEFGSRFVMQAVELGGVFTHSISNSKLQPNCENCTLCEKACPTGAITKNGFDAKKCLRYLQENEEFLEDETAKKMQNKLLGCDICQAVCPYNKTQKRIPMEQNLKETLQLETLLKTFQNDDFDKKKWSSSIGKNYAREKLFLPNLLLIAGNSNNQKLVPYLKFFVENKTGLMQKNALRSLSNLQHDKKE